jgi:hypothetical protein
MLDDALLSRSLVQRALVSHPILLNSIDPLYEAVTPSHLHFKMDPGLAPG